MVGEEEKRSEIDIVNDFIKKYDYMEIEELEDIYDTAVNTYLDLTYPFKQDITEIPVDVRPRAKRWVKDCMREIIDRSGITATSYSENGVSITWSTDMVSDALRRRIVPCVGVVRARN